MKRLRRMIEESNCGTGFWNIKVVIGVETDKAGRSIEVRGQCQGEP